MLEIVRVMKITQAKDETDSNFIPKSTILWFFLSSIQTFFITQVVHVFKEIKGFKVFL
jgi:hypothetical protein